MRLSTEQRDRILYLLGRIEAERRGLDLHTLDRLDASHLIRLLEAGDVLTLVDGPHFYPTPTTAPIGTRRRAGNDGPLPKRITSRGWTLRSDPQHPDHGTRSGYSAGCRCPACTNAATVDRRRRRSITKGVPA